MFSGTSGAIYQDTLITNDGFWPDINAGDFEKRRGVPASTDANRIAMALVNAMAEVNKQLKSVKKEFIKNGYETAISIPARPAIDGKNRIVIQYEGAISARAKADLLPDFATVSQRKEGDHLAERSEDLRNELLAESERIIRNMSGLNRSTVTLL